MSVRHRTALWVLAALVVGPGRVSAQPPADPPPASPDSQVARLEALLEAQARKIEALEQKVAAAAQQDVDQARIAQMREQIREILSEREFRESLMPTTTQAGYKDGFYIRSTDDKFSFKFNGLFQLRFTHYGTRSENRYLAPGFRRDDRTGFDIARLRFRFSGHVYDKDLTWLMELDSSSPQAYDARMLYAWVNYRLCDEFQVKTGLFRLASTRADFGSTSAMQFVDYPPMNAVFGMGTGAGVRFWGQVFDKTVDWYVDVVNSLGTTGTQTITNDEDLFISGHDNNPAILARAVWRVLQGECESPPPESSRMFEQYCDIEMHTQPALELGGHYAFNEDVHDGTLRIPFPSRNWQTGGFGLTSSDGLQINQFGLDAAFKYLGFSATAEYALRLLDVRNGGFSATTPLYQLTGDGSTNAQHGAYVQVGYFLPIPGLERKLEVVGRVGGISTLAAGQEGTWEYAGGLNYYINGNRVKLQTDVTKITEIPISSPTYSFANVNDDALIWRVQLQVAF